eukprot:101715_1
MLLIQLSDLGYEFCVKCLKKEGKAETIENVDSIAVNNDLRKIGKTFLPPNISTISSKQIHGRCLLQIMSIRNCNTPSTNQDRAASSSSHLVSMALTDGFVKCNAVEDYPIDAFRRFSSILPGTKIVLEDFHVRYGVIIISSRSFVSLCGGVDSLAKSWSLKKNSSLRHTKSAGGDDPPPRFIPFDIKASTEVRTIRDEHVVHHDRKKIDDEKSRSINTLTLMQFCKLDSGAKCSIIAAVTDLQLLSISNDVHFLQFTLKDESGTAVAVSSPDLFENLMLSSQYELHSRLQSSSGARDVDSQIRDLCSSLIDHTFILNCYIQQHGMAFLVISMEISAGNYSQRSVGTFGYGNSYGRGSDRERSYRKSRTRGSGRNYNPRNGRHRKNK